MGALATLWTRRYAWARLFAGAHVTLILLGWMASVAPAIIVPDVTVASAAARRETLWPLLASVAAGSVVLVPSLWLLFRVFKGPRRAAQAPASDISESVRVRRA